ncbi:hypothetical protein DS743_07070 [Lactobacillus leichmannii]|uniref:Uncharacterized protein n=1 Tax=Lactobacillus leichmannii TaxID=28039 RepID=A0ABT1XY46_LACLE|nr:hypothetical protein [Lactobacillus delbrueckii subsp. bulgaricus]MCR5971564.1 hypothetical protein [Lactobacillus leichmannii]PKZ82100.1 hypothetical protein CYJ84_04495 [Lactobacillus delbrueckii]RXS49404.1 hypothetical protein ETB92_02690 [Lactobacillus delbrueckii subsp. bulgaricus]UBV31512.1 hypothetical protein HR078_03750 [Lactobacillus delbrueckii subsp. lactis]
MACSWSFCRPFCPFAGRAASLDTMGDLIADLASSLLFSCWSYWQLKNDRSWLKTFFFKKYSPDD